MVGLARPELEQSRVAHGDTTCLGILDDTVVVHSAVCENTYGVRLAARPGDREHIHTTALGKAICALLPQERVRSIIGAADTQRLTRAAVTDTSGSLAKLDHLRAPRHAVDAEENQPAGRCMAGAIGGLAFPADISINAPVS